MTAGSKSEGVPIARKLAGKSNSHELCLYEGSTLILRYCLTTYVKFVRAFEIGVPHRGGMSYRLEKDKWLEDHTDSVLGRPIDDGQSVGSVRVIQFNTPFEYSESGSVYVCTDEFPAYSQREIFLWMSEEMDRIAMEVPGLLLRSTVADRQDESWFYEVSSESVAAEAFQPKHIYGIWFKGTNPVSWTIQFYCLVDQNCRGTLRGKDKVLTTALLWQD